MELQHFSHYHALKYRKVLDENDPGRYCDGCLKPISGANYSCKRCCFILHKSCAELPRELQHPSHPKHTLILHARLDWDRIKCDGCEGEFFNFSYHCSHCEFNLDPKCASLPLIKESESHDHPLTLVRKSLPFNCDICWEEGKGMFYFCATCSLGAHIKCSSLPLITRPLTKNSEMHNHPLTLVRNCLSFTCDACGKEGKHPLYFCATCSFAVDEKCASLPSIVKVLRHKQHPLNLTYDLQINGSHRKVCQICAQTVDTNYGVYYCSSCNFLTHLRCATTKEEMDETFVRELKDTEHVEYSTNMSEDDDAERGESSDLSPYVANKIKLGVDGIEIAEEIKHFSHKHELKLTDELDISEQCDVCELPIFPHFYKCTECRFFLHRSCAELPRKKRHPLHKHPLILQLTGLWCACYACLRVSKGFKYYCGECHEFYLDVRCSSVPNILKHDGHEHQLILCHSSDRVKCSCCDSRSRYIFRCGDCEFVLDFKCATLPHSAIYGPHEHPFKLWYTAEDDSGEYYCDICEEERDPKHWFYYCKDCSYPAHPNCILKYEYWG